MFWAELIGDFLEAVAHVSTGAEDTRREDPLWLDLLILLSPFVMTDAAAAFALLLPWQMALALTLVVVIVTLWGIVSLLELPRKKIST